MSLFLVRFVVKIGKKEYFDSKIPQSLSEGFFVFLALCIIPCAFFSSQSFLDGQFSTRATFMRCMSESNIASGYTKSDIGYRNALIEAFPSILTHPHLICPSSQVRGKEPPLQLSHTTAHTQGFACRVPLACSLRVVCHGCGWFSLSP